MLTPRFELSQNDDKVTVNIYAPYANIKDTEVYVEDTDFRFYSAPYYLRLKLPGKIVENDESTGSYDCDTGTFVLKFSKVNKGEHFENLDMITTLLAPPNSRKNIKPTIEVIGNPAVTDDVDQAQDEETHESDEWFINQVPNSTNNLNILGNAPKYGFANKTSKALAAFDEGWLKDVVDLPNPDNTPASERKLLREAEEADKFNDEHYMGNMLEFIEEKEEIKFVIDFQPVWYNLKPDDVQLTDSEKDLLKEMPNREYLLDSNEIQLVLHGLVDILFASCYNHRATLGENTSESSWDINKISATLSWFEIFPSMEEVIRSCIRRTLCYPWYRHWCISLKVFDDVKVLVKLGKKSILKQLCQVHELFNKSHEPRYLLNELYIKDYIIWLQQCSETLIQSISEALECISPKKENMGLDLIETDAAFWSTYEEATGDLIAENNLKTKSTNGVEYFINDIVDEVDKLVLNDGKSEESCYTEDSDSDSSSTSCSSCKSVGSSSSSDSSSSSSSSSSISSNESTTSDSCDEKPANTKHQLDSDDDDDDDDDCDSD